MDRPIPYAEFPSELCSIARTSEIIGDRWTLLIVRDLTNGVRRFDVLREHLGIARDVLARRLDRLAEHGVVERVAYREPGQRRRHEYRLTPRGRDLTAILAALMAWGDRYLAGEPGPPVRLEHRGCGGEVTVALRCSEGHPVAPGRELALRPGPALFAALPPRDATEDR